MTPRQLFFSYLHVAAAPPPIMDDEYGLEGDYDMDDIDVPHHQVNYPTIQCPFMVEANRVWFERVNVPFTMDDLNEHTMWSRVLFAFRCYDSIISAENEL